MKVGRRLKRNLVTIGPDDGLDVAFQLMVANRIRHLPVVEDGELLGILSERDLKGALTLSPKPDASRESYFIPPGVTVGEIMVRRPISISPETDVEEAARLMYRHKIGSLPVVEGRTVVGIITEADILEIFIEIMGVIESSSRIDVEMDDEPESLNRAAEVIRKNRGRIISVAMAPPGEDHRRTYYFRLESCNTRPIVESLKHEGFKVNSVMD